MKQFTKKIPVYYLIVKAWNEGEDTVNEFTDIYTKKPKKRDIEIEVLRRGFDKLVYFDVKKVVRTYFFDVDDVLNSNLLRYEEEEVTA